MNPTDERHGTPRGYRLHREDGQDACEPCALAWYRYNKRATYLREIGSSLQVPAIGTQRRIRSLMAMGHGLPSLAAELGIATGNLSYKMQQPFMARRTYESVAALYERLATEPEPAGWVAQRTRNIAEKRGWAKPDRWLNPDDPDEQPDPGYRSRMDADECDPVVVDRILAGDYTLARSATRAERVQVVARWTGTTNALEERTGWQPQRYRSEVAS